MQTVSQLDFLGKRKLAFIFSGLLVAASILSLCINGLNLGIDFTGGSVYEMHFNQSVDLTKMRDSFAERGFADANVQHFGSSEEVLVRLKPITAVNQQQLGQQVLDAANASQTQPGELRRVEFVGPQVGDELLDDGGLALLFAFIGVMIYVSVRFEWKFSVGAVLALVHDSVITLGFFSVFGWEFDMTVLSALLAIIGYSINDTIVVYDRIRENFRSSRVSSVDEVTNVALNETLSRTLLTSFTVFLTVLALVFLGGKTIHGFSVAMLIGVVVGTYSSIYVASAIALALGLNKDDVMEIQRDNTIEDLP
ncbi:protein translocase subunit SecF [Methylomonas sp. HYX-M1]|uniref:protein translocase subunit SecF n=1 Tax=Methylomonas sp. HYX-M1 TaxID=3139307 RepID=UPI00345BCB28